MDFHNDALQLRIGRTVLAATDCGSKLLIL
jgi:hypothetical protein